MFEKHFPASVIMSQFTFHSLLHILWGSGVIAAVVNHYNDNNNEFSIPSFMYLPMQYHDEQDVGFGSSLLCSLFLLLFVASVQALVLPRTLLFLFLFLAAFVTISVILIVLLASR